MDRQTLLTLIGAAYAAGDTAARGTYSFDREHLASLLGHLRQQAATAGIDLGTDLLDTLTLASNDAHDAADERTAARQARDAQEV